MKNAKKTTAQDWLQLDLKAQSGAIWTSEKSRLLKKNKAKPYQAPKEKSHLLNPDPELYNGKKIPIDNSSIID
ncbi:hypothetical protein [Chryseobacterium schmidteae]|uniref:hypothetical protein n=1 Tax=Chryseobacterium schmidteae TaxID=2730404 RepID=UPI0015898786|nr:hypothetical protein [Chryseobacterium schmidteae]